MCRLSPFMGMIRILYTVGCGLGGWVKCPPSNGIWKDVLFQDPLRSVPFERVPRFRASLQSVGPASE